MSFSPRIWPWLNDPQLRATYIEHAHLLSIEDELKIYERAIEVGETDAVRSSLSAFAYARKFPTEEPLKGRMERIMNAVGFERERFRPAD